MKTINTNNYVKVRLNNEIKEEIHKRADRLGMTMSGYMQYLAVKDVAETEQRMQIFLIDNIKELIKDLMRVNFKKSMTLLRSRESNPA